jgi:catechol 2,3-dioxygenase-like lactoylglutathione lyase family enzyme
MRWKAPKGGPVREFGTSPSHDDYLKLDPGFEKRTLAFIQKNAAAKKPFFVAWWTALGSFLPSPKRLTANGGVLQELLAPLDVCIGTLMSELKKLGIAENTLVVLMADTARWCTTARPAWLTPSAIEATAQLTALGYIGVRSTRLEDWGAFATRLLGMQQVDRAGAVRAFRMDDRKQRLIATGDDGEGLGFLGWGVADAAALDALAACLDAHGVKVRRAPGALADERHVADLIVFQDPAGNRLEVFHVPAIAGDPFRPGRPISGFRAGPLGMGRAALNVKDAEKNL